MMREMESLAPSLLVEARVNHRQRRSIDVLGAIGIDERMLRPVDRGEDEARREERKDEDDERWAELPRRERDDDTEEERVARDREERQPRALPLPKEEERQLDVVEEHEAAEV